MKAKMIGLLVTLACAVCFGLASCASAPEDFTPNFVGTWELSSIEGEEGGMTADEFAMLKEMGITASLDLLEDGTYTLDLFGDQRSGTWEATAADAASIALEDGQLAVTLSGDNLIFENGANNQTLVFAKEGATTATSAASSEVADEADESTESSEDTEDEDAA